MNGTATCSESDLGEHQLKDLDRPVRLYQAAADGLPASFPPLRHGSPLAQAAEAAIRAPLLRRPSTIIATVLVLGAAFATAVFWQREIPGAGAVQPNHVGLIDPETNEITAEIPVGISPGPRDPKRLSRPRETSYLQDFFFSFASSSASFDGLRGQASGAGADRVSYGAACQHDPGR